MKKATFTSRIILIFILTVSLSVASYTVFVMKDTYEIANNQIENLTKTLSENISNNTDIFIKLMDRVSIVLLNSPEVRDDLDIIQDDSLDYFVQRKAQEDLQLTSYAVTTTRDFFYITYYGKDGNLLFSTASIDDDSQNLFETTTIIQEEKFTSKILSPIDTDLSFYESDNPIALIRSLINPSNGEISGYIMVFCDAKRVWNDDTAKVVSSIDVPIKYIQLLKDNNGNIILSNPSDYTSAEENIFFNNWQSDYTNWDVEVGIDKNDYYRVIFRSKIYGLLIPFLIIIIITMILIRVLNKSLYPFNNLVKKMKRVAEGDYSQRIEEETWFNDIDLVMNGFNTMTGEIDNLVNTVYANEILYHKVQLEMLKLQINPHFLYNTLQSIEAMGEINDVPEVSEISHLLGNILRYNLKERDIVTLDEEVESLYDYLKIQKIRFEEKVDWRFELQDETISLNIPKFILQPTLENCVVHGISGSTNNIMIYLSSYISDNNLFVVIQDNGNGMKREELESINKKLRENSKSISKEHIGLLNVNRRIKTRYGNEYGIILDSELNSFTKAIYQLPINREVYLDV